MRRYLIPALIGSNCLLIIAGWAMALVAFPRLPQHILLWVNLMGQPPLWVAKTPAFFLYPAAQVFFAILFSLASRLVHLPAQTASERGRGAIQYLWREQAWTALIFFNLILIHLQRSIIFLSHGLKEGIHPTYLMLLLLFLLFLIPAYRWRTRREMAAAA